MLIFSDSYFQIVYEMDTWPLFYITACISPVVEAMREARKMYHFMKFQVTDGGLV